MSIFKRKLKTGYSWRAVVRVKGHPTVCASFSRKQEAEDWKRETKQQIKSGKYRIAKSSERKLLAELIDAYNRDVVDAHYKAVADTKRHLAYFRETIGEYALIYLTPELILEQRRRLIETPTDRGARRSAATVNRYMSSLRGALRYACRSLRWIDENPIQNLIKLKESPQKRRILSEEEEIRLLDACKRSSNRYLYCITLIAITTGARKGEILALTWDCIDFEERIAWIKKSKNGRPRRIGLVASVISKLQTLYDSRDPSKHLIFASKTAFGKLDPKKAWERALQEADIDNFVFHGLRHHFASFGGNIGATGVQLRTQLGHTTSTMTDHYTHGDAQTTRFIGEAIEKRFLQGEKNDDSSSE